LINDTKLFFTLITHPNETLLPIIKLGLCPKITIPPEIEATYPVPFPMFINIQIEGSETAAATIVELRET